jgi:hypothetical protein
LVLFISFRYFKTSKTTALLLMLVIQSHWLLDFIVHNPDLMLLPSFNLDGVKIGLGLWNNAIVTFSVECGLLIGSFVFYFNRTHAISRVGHLGPILFLCTLIIIQAVMIFGPYMPITKNGFAIMALISFFLFTLVAGFLEQYRHGGKPPSN